MRSLVKITQAGFRQFGWQLVCCHLSFLLDVKDPSLRNTAWSVLHPSSPHQSCSAHLYRWRDGLRETVAGWIVSRTEEMVQNLCAVDTQAARSWTRTRTLFCFAFALLCRGHSSYESLLGSSKKPPCLGEASVPARLMEVWGAVALVSLLCRLSPTHLIDRYLRLSNDCRNISINGRQWAMLSHLGICMPVGTLLDMKTSSV